MGYVMPRGGYIGDTYTGGAPPAGGGPGYAMSSSSTVNSGIPELRPQVVSNLSGALQGDLPPDVVDQIRNHAAEFGVASGMPGSEFAGYQGLRNLGLTSLNRMQHAEDLLAPGYRQSSEYQFHPPGPTDSLAFTRHANEVNFGGHGFNNEVPAYVAPGQTHNYGSGGLPPGSQMPKQPDAHALIGDFLARYLPGGSGGMGSMASPMGANAQRGPATPAPSANANNMSNSDLVDMGLIDPAFDQPNTQEGAFTGDINNYEDWGDEAYV